ncbi:hypothetical protein ACIRPQ_08080 [Streptomyces sp. NPDC101213]|uniref:hypothetical protein n=1 Tax=Streptomyces sp. NPDC101213 TaxID=3366130 RepID=UPI00381EB571
MDMKSHLSIAGPSGCGGHGEKDTAATRSHRVLLYCALDTAAVPLDVVDVQAVFQVAELDYITVQAVIAWITGTRTAKTAFTG